MTLSTLHSLIYLLFNVGEVTLYSSTNLKKKKKNSRPTYPLSKHLSRQLQTNILLSMA